MKESDYMNLNPEFGDNVAPINPIKHDFYFNELNDLAETYRKVLENRHDCKLLGIEVKPLYEFPEDRYYETLEKRAGDLSSIRLPVDKQSRAFNSFRKMLVPGFLQDSVVCYFANNFSKGSHLFGNKLFVPTGVFRRLSRKSIDEEILRSLYQVNEK